MIFILRDKNIDIEYRTLLDEVIYSFYIPILNDAIIYKRAVGFFSSSILLQISSGLCSIAKRGGKIKLLVSPKLEKNDYEAIENGYNIKEKIENNMIDNFSDPIEQVDKDRFALLAHLIASGILEIKVAIIEKNFYSAMYHEKVGIVKDPRGDIVVFSGSPNETSNAYNENYETIDVFCSWKENENERCQKKDLAYDRLWNNREKGVLVIDFPSIIKEKILKFHDKFNETILNLDDEFVRKYEKQKYKKPEPTNPIRPLYDYQLEAIQAWRLNNYIGIFDMATGTGKTFAAGGAIVSLYTDKKRLFVVICCPYIHLVDQWYDELANFNIHGIKCYSDSPDYKKLILRAVNNYRFGIENFVCLITTNKTFMSDFFQQNISINSKDTLIVCDEAHNFGADKISNFLDERFPFRLALSATLDRFGDEIGTAKLYSYFNKKCIEYPLERAIHEGKLTPYKYYPIPISLTESELDEYLSITENIKSSIAKNPDKNEMSEYTKRLLIKRARIISGARNKIPALINEISKYKNDNNILIYCGAVKYGDDDYDDATAEKKQIQAVIKKLYTDLNMKVAKFTSEEDYEQRNSLKIAFQENNIQVLVAIKCLDEGMNIPAIRTAFILASSTNPKEYIQRRGRVLRIYKNKEYAEIYDFITLTRPIEDLLRINTPTLEEERNLVKKELSRLEDFAQISSNPTFSNDLTSKIREAYKFGYE